ncbi:MAG: hypothetical protein LBB48_04115 [Treponema sp.]|nr:hypothetical protein [Treponema sp.]
MSVIFAACTSLGNLFESEVEEMDDEGMLLLRKRTRNVRNRAVASFKPCDSDWFRV